MPARLLLTTVVVAILLLAGISAVDAAYGNSGKTNSISNESFTPSVGANELNLSNLDGVVYYPESSIAVFDENDTEMIGGEDYEWNRTNGTVNVLSGGRLDGDSSASINYGYAAPTGVQRSIAETFGHGFEAGALLVFVLVVAFAVAGIKVLGVF